MTLTVLRRPELADDLMMLPADLQDVNIEYFPGHSQPHYLTPVEASTTLDAPARFTTSHSITNLDDSRLEPPTCEAPPAAPPERHEPTSTWSTSAGYAEPYQSPPIYYGHQPGYGEPYSYPAESWALAPPGAGPPLLWSGGPDPVTARAPLGVCQTDYGQPPPPPPPAAWADGREPSPPAAWGDGRDPSPPRPLGAESATPPQQYWSPPATAARDPRATSPAFFPGPLRSPGARYTLADVRVQRTGRTPFSGAEAGGSRRRNRRQKGQPKIGKLWQFLLALLHDKSHNPSMIKWDDFEQGRFKFVQSEAVARLWGSRKGYETNMTYEKLSRAMRYYYKPGILEPVVGRRLVYAFGPNADWKTPPDVSLA